MNLLKRIFDNTGKLNIEGRVLYAHAMHLSQIDDLPEVLIEYVWKNTNSMREIASLYQLLDKETVLRNPHPYFLKQGHTPKTSLVSIDWNNLDAALEDILRSALSENSTPNRKMERKIALSFKASNTSFRVIHPAKDVVCVQQIHFQFSHTTTHSLFLYLQSAKGKSKAEFEIPSNSKEFIVSIKDVQQFPTGLYYWTILVDRTPFTNRLYICSEEEAKQILSANS
ncbi:MAG: hypothetical protein AB8B69_06005 [Chitinophagales bacterium]